MHEKATHDDRLSEHYAARRRIVERFALLTVVRVSSMEGGDKPMYNSEQYRAKAAQAGDSARQSKSLKDMREFLRAQQSYIALAENEEWVERNRDKLISKTS